MPFPVIESTAESSVNTAGTSHAVTLPGSIAAADLVLIIMNIGSTSATLNALTDWGEILDEASANGLKILRYTGAGVPSTPTFTSSGSTRSASIACRISNANKSITPQIGTTSTGTSATPDPPASAAPPSTKDYLFIAFAGMAGEEADDDTWGNTPPTNYTPNPPLQKSCGTAGTNLGGLILAASRQLNTGSAQDPGSFGVDVSAAWRAQTITIHPIEDTAVTPSTASLATAAFAPTATTTNNVRVTPGVASLSLSVFAPTVQVPRLLTPGNASLSLTTFAPTVTATTGSNITVTPDTASLSLSAFAPVVSAPRLATPATASLSLSMFTPTVSTPRLVTPGTSSLSVNAFAPTISAPQLCTPGTASLLLTTLTPAVVNPKSASPSTANLTLTTFIPSVTAGASGTYTPATALLALTTYAPTVGAPRNVTPSTTAMVLASFSPTVTATGGGGGGAGGGRDVFSAFVIGR